MFHQAASASFTEISLDVDADRDGIVEKNNPNKVCISFFFYPCWKNDTVLVGNSLLSEQNFSRYSLGTTLYLVNWFMRVFLLLKKILPLFFSFSIRLCGNGVLMDMVLFCWSTVTRSLPTSSKWTVRKRRSVQAQVRKYTPQHPSSVHIIVSIQCNVV